MRIVQTVRLYFGPEDGDLARARGAALVSKEYAVYSVDCEERL